jgi:hypothetical protein
MLNHDIRPERLGFAPLAAAAHEKNSKTTKQRQVCKANFYSEELPLLQSAKEEVLRLSK